MRSMSIPVTLEYSTEPAQSSLLLKPLGLPKSRRMGGKSLQIFSEHIEGYMELSVRSTTPGFKGYKIAFAAKNVPRTSIFGGGSFKAGFNLTDAASSNDFQIVKVPFKEFSYDWSPFTGRCDTKGSNWPTTPLLFRRRQWKVLSNCIVPCDYHGY